MKYTRVVFVKTLPLFLISFILIFFFVYQLAIGNAFLEEIHPALVLIVFLALVLFYNLYLSTFSIHVKDGKVILRLGFFRSYFYLSQIVEVREIDLKNFSYGVVKNHNIIMFIVDRKPCLEITLRNGEKVIVSEREIRNFINNLRR